MKKIFLKEALIGLDIDGVFRNFTKAYNEAYNIEAASGHTIVFPYTRAKVPLVDINFEPPIYHFSDNDIYDKKILDCAWLLHQSTMFEHAELYNGAKNMFEFINEVGCEHSFFITHQFTKEAEIATLKWLLKHDLAHSCIFCPGDDKWKYCDVLLDDKIENLEAMDRLGKISFCLARPWNTDYKGKRGTYNDFKEFLLEIGV